MIDPETYPSVPLPIVPQIVTLGDGSQAEVVTVADAALLVDLPWGTIDDWIRKGKIAICYTPDHERRVFVDGLWKALPIELRR